MGKWDATFYRSLLVEICLLLHRKHEIRACPLGHTLCFPFQIMTGHGRTFGGGFEYDGRAHAGNGLDGVDFLLDDCVQLVGVRGADFRR